MFPSSSNSILWASTVVTLLKKPVSVQEIFQYALPSASWQLEAFQFHLEKHTPEPHGSVIATKISLSIIGLLQQRTTQERQTLNRHETICRRFPLTNFISPEENQTPEHWEISLEHISCEPNLTRETLTVTLSFSLHICGIKQRIILLPQTEENPNPSSPPQNQIQYLQHELTLCREELLAVKEKLRRLEKATLPPASPNHATIGKTTAQYRRSPQTM